MGAKVHATAEAALVERVKEPFGHGTGATAPVGQ
jgi:hypothetical protein